jgi:hypothetical protein
MTVVTSTVHDEPSLSRMVKTLFQKKDKRSVKSIFLGYSRAFDDLLR